MAFCVTLKEKKKLMKNEAMQIARIPVPPNLKLTEYTCLWFIC